MTFKYLHTLVHDITQAAQGIARLLLFRFSYIFIKTDIYMPMRLAFFNANKGWGGVKTWTLEFAAALQRLGHSVIIIGRQGPFIDRALQLGLDARPVEFGPDYNPAAICRFVRLLKQEKIQAALVNVGRDLRTAGIAARLCKIPVVQRVGLPGDMKNKWKVRALHRWIQPHYLYPCHFNKNGMLAVHPYIDKSNTTVIHSAKIPVQSAPERVGSPLRLITTSQLERSKGHDKLIPVLARLADRGFQFTWEVAGAGSTEQALRQLVREYGLDDRVIWHGWTHNIKDYLEQADIFVLPSMSEGLPNTLLEAMAVGLIPVAHNVGGISEVWPEEMNQLLVPRSEDLEGFETALATVLQADETQLVEWKQRAWEQCCSSFSLETQAVKLEDFFQRLTQ